MIEDISCKGVAASILMSQLHAMFRTLVALDLPLKQMVDRASRTCCESTATSHYATLVCGRAERDGGVELYTAGHLRPPVSDAKTVFELTAPGPPFGMFCDQRFDVVRVSLERGGTLLLSTDGFTESGISSAQEFGRPRLAELFRHDAFAPPRQLIERCLAELSGFLAGEPRRDDLMIMALRRD